MKLKFQSLFLFMLFAAVTISCSDDDDESTTRNEYIYNGVTHQIGTALIEDGSKGGEGGGYSFWFSKNVYQKGDAWPEYIWIDIPEELLGTKIVCTDDERTYNWTWWVEYIDEEAELSYSGLGDVGEMNDVQSGTISITSLGNGVYEVEVDFVFTDDKTLKITYSGTPQVWGEDGRKSTHQPKKISPNNK